MKRLNVIALTLALLLVGGGYSLTASAATGGITKTATKCAGGTTKTVETWCSGSFSEGRTFSVDHTCGESLYNDEGTFIGKCYGTYYAWYTMYECSECGQEESHSWIEPCDQCGQCDFSYDFPADLGPHRKTTSETVPCSHNHTSSHYYDTSYGYDGSASTFTVYPLTMAIGEGISSTLKVSSATATDAAMSGRSVTLSLSGAPEGVKYKVTNSATQTSQTVAYSYSFTMPSEPVTLTVEYALAVNPSPSQVNLFVGQSKVITPNQQPSAAIVTYASNNTSIATVSSSGKVTGKKKGSTNITVTATA